jgi:hypothetical protein
MSLGTELAVYLQTQGLGNFNGAGTINLFVSLLPDTPDQAVAIFERGGYPPTIWQTGGGQEESKIDNPVVQIRVRDDISEYNRAYTTANAIYGALQGINNTRINSPTDQLFLLIDAQQSPEYIGRDVKQRHEFTQNFRIQFQNLAR